MLFAISFALFCLTYTVCSADLTATPLEKGIIELTWSGGGSHVYRDTSILKGLDDITEKLWKLNATTGWKDGEH